MLLFVTLILSALASFAISSDYKFEDADIPEEYNSCLDEDLRCEEWVFQKKWCLYEHPISVLSRMQSLPFNLNVTIWVRK